MKIPLFMVGAAGALCLLVACTTFDSRIKENQAEFDHLKPIDQQIIRNGFIKVGYTPAMVYMALDTPERKIPGAVPGEQIWVYHNFYSRGGGSLTDPQKVVTHPAKNPQNNTYSVEPDPQAENIKSDAAIRVHVKFAEGKVSTIEIVRLH